MNLQPFVLATMVVLLACCKSSGESPREEAKALWTLDALADVTEDTFETDLVFCAEPPRGNTGAYQRNELGELMEVPDPSVLLRRDCVPLPPALRSPDPFDIQPQTHDVSLLAALEEMRESPLLYFSTLENNFDQIVRDSFIYGRRQSPQASEWRRHAVYVEEVFQRLLAAVPVPLNRRVPLRVVDQPAFLRAQAPAGEAIEISPGLLRAFFASCAGFLRRVNEFSTAFRQCPQADPRRCQGFMVLQCQQEQTDRYFTPAQQSRACNVARSTNLPEVERLVGFSRSCLSSAAAFILAHEISHVYLRHSFGSADFEQEADNCARILLREIGMTDYEALSSALIEAVGYPELFGIQTNEQVGELRIRIERLSEPLSPGQRERCLFPTGVPAAN